MRNLIFTLLVISIKAMAFTPSEILKKSDEKRGLTNSFSVQVQVDVTEKNKKSQSAFKVSNKDVNTALVEQFEPERSKGRKILMTGYDMWIFTPNIKRPVRISLEQKLTGEVANGDIARTNFSEDYTPEIQSEETVGPIKAWKLNLKSKDKKTTYSRIELWVSQKDFAPIKATFFALSGKPLKTAEFLDFKLIEGLTRSTKMIIRNFLAKDEVSVLTYSKFKKESFSDSLFNKDHMDF